MSLTSPAASRTRHRDAVVDVNVVLGDGPSLPCRVSRGVLIWRVTDRSSLVTPHSVDFLA